MKIVTQKIIPLFSLIFLLNSFSIFGIKSSNRNTTFNTNKHSDSRLSTFNNRLKIRFKKGCYLLLPDQSKENVGELDDDLELPNIILDKELSLSSEEDNTDNYSTLPYTEENEVFINNYTRKNGPIIIFKDNEVALSELHVDEYLQNFFLKIMLVAKVIINQQVFVRL